MNAAAEQAERSAVRLTKPSQPKVSATLEPEDVADLRAYCKEDGIYMPTHSTLSAALLRAELSSMGCTGCRQCGGTKVKSGRGFVPVAERLAPTKSVKRQAFARRKLERKKAKRGPPPTVTYKKALHLYRKAQAKRYGWMVAATTRQRDELRLRGNEAYTRKELAAFYPDLPELLLALCKKCKGAGTIPRLAKERKANAKLTARPTGSSKKPAEGGGAEMDEEALHKRGKIDKRLAEVRRREPSVAGILDTHFQPGNETLRSLWRFTRYGQILLGDENPNGLTDRARITALLDAVHQSKNDVKRNYIDLADREAQRLLDLAIMTWNTVMAELVQRSSRDKNGTRLKTGHTVLVFDDGKLRRGLVEAQDREFWKVRCFGSKTHRVEGWYLEAVA